MTQTPEIKISTAGIPVYLHGFSAIDSYLGRNPATAVYALCCADLADLACIFEGIRYPGAAFADAAVDSNGKTWYFRCEDALKIPCPYHSFSFLEFYQDCKTRRYYDPNDIYPLLRRMRDGIMPENAEDKPWQFPLPNNVPPYRTIFDLAMILAKYFPETAVRDIRKIAAGFSVQNPAVPPGIEEQRLLLLELLDAQNPAAGFELLMECGFIAAAWPELAVLDDVDQSKEFHPEGNAWKHTLEALRYRKAGGKKTGFDLRLSLGLLLHDAGKPVANQAGSRRFSGHAELGEKEARRFLARLDFDASVVNDVCYLVRNHMLPAALPRLPLARTGEIMESPLFPLLMELYRCDESSSVKGLDNYYQSSAAYQSYLKYRKNPYRAANGSRLAKTGPHLYF
jgi:poly(A) polymerase